MEIKIVEPIFAQCFISISRRKRQKQASMIFSGGIEMEHWAKRAELTYWRVDKGKFFCNHNHTYNSQHL